jgi:PAS domain S-box-containing protein
MGSSMALVAVHKDGTEIPVEVSLSPVETEAGMLVSSAIRDVSERRRNEARVLSAAIVESSDDAIYSCDVDGLIEIWNASATRLFGYAADEVVGTRAETIIPLGRRLEMSVLFARALEGVAVEQYETERKRKDGADVEVSLSLSPMCDAEERVVGVSVIARDITRAKEAERRLVASLREKEVLLKEVHHRVKNHLQIISSLLNMHGSRTSESQSTFQEMQDRIRAIALFHEKLYRSSDVSFIDFAEYLRELASSVVLQHGTPERVGVRVDAESLNLGVDVAIPCGLIANELITNALKYAFIDSSDLGHHNVDVTFRSRDGMSEFVVRDDGRGLPTGFDILAAETLGLQLVRALVEQIHGTFELDSSQSQGTCVRIRFATHPGGSG